MSDRKPPIPRGERRADLQNSRAWQCFLASAYLSCDPQHQEALTRDVAPHWEPQIAKEVKSSALTVPNFDLEFLDAIVLCDAPSNLLASGRQLSTWLGADSQRLCTFLESTPKGLARRLAELDVGNWLGWGQCAVHFCPNPHREVVLELLSSELRGERFTVHHFDGNAFWEIFRVQLLARTRLTRGICDELLGFPDTAKFALANAARQVGDGDLQALRGALAGVPVLICGAGSSLNGALADVEEFAKRGLVIGCGSGALALQRAAITPHLVATVCPMRASWERWQQLDQFTAPAMTCLRAHPLVVDMLQGPRVHLTGLSRSPSVLWVEQALDFGDPELDFGCSVLTATLRACIAMGCETIGMVGVDLCYGPAGELYSDRVVPGRARDSALPIGELAEALATSGQRVLTRLSWLAERDWIEALIAAHSKVRVFNASSRGLVVSGASNVELGSWLRSQTWPQRDLSNLLWRRLTERGVEVSSTARALDSIAASLQRCLLRAVAERNSLSQLLFRAAELSPEDLQGQLERLDGAFTGEVAFEVLLKPVQEALMHVHQGALRRLKSRPFAYGASSAPGPQLLQFAIHRLEVFQKRGENWLAAIHEARLQLPLTP